jgi:riboflavin kinase/FMN adenylyltransferase
VITIGAYDGVHLGHRAVIGEVQRQARELECDTAVVTFDRHPATVVRPESAPLLLTDLDQKLELLAATGIDHCVVIHFDEERAKEPAEDFVQEVLVDCLRARAVVVGSDFHFGHQRRGNVAMLERMGTAAGFSVTGVGLVGGEGGAEPVSSTRIRRALLEGRIDEATAMLGRPHEVRGIVVAAHVSVPHELCLPPDGRYRGVVVGPDGVEHDAVIERGALPSGYEVAQASLLAVRRSDGGDLVADTPVRVRFGGHA